MISGRLGDEIHIKYILDLRDFPGTPYADKIIHDFECIRRDPEIALVAEMMGGAHPAYDFTKACLEAGKSVVTSNKEVVAAFGAQLLAIARKHSVTYAFEASVGGGIPIIRPLCKDFVSNEISEISGILNGTTNYILTEMLEAGKSYDEALAEAQKKICRKGSDGRCRRHRHLPQDLHPRRDGDRSAARGKSCENPRDPKY